MFFKIGTLKNFANFTGKHLCWSLFWLSCSTKGFQLFQYCSKSSELKWCHYFSYWKMLVRLADLVLLLQIYGWSLAWPTSETANFVYGDTTSLRWVGNLYGALLEFYNKSYGFLRLRRSSNCSFMWDVHISNPLGAATFKAHELVKIYKDLVKLVKIYTKCFIIEKSLSIKR